MPIVVEFLNEPTEQDLTDLQKIYADAPTWMYEEFGELEFVATRLSDSESGQLVVARFNERLLGACWLQAPAENSENSHQIRWLTVRKATRGRGVASRMLAQIEQLIKHEHTMFQLSLATRQCAATDALLQVSGFEKKGEIKDRVLWIKKKTHI